MDNILVIIDPMAVRDAGNRVDGGGCWWRRGACRANGSVDRSRTWRWVGESRWGRRISHGAAWLVHVNESHVVGA